MKNLPALFPVLWAAACASPQAAPKDTPSSAPAAKTSAAADFDASALTEPRAVSLTYAVDFSSAVDKDAKTPISVFIPLPAEDAFQKILSESVQAGFPGEVAVESVYGNRYWHGVFDPTAGHRPEVTLSAQVLRQPSTNGVQAASLSAANERQFLQANALVPVGAQILSPILADIETSLKIKPGMGTPRAIFDWVVDNVTYKKVGTGWGNGDTHWACNERYGNCTDFHSLYISLARTLKVPARFEMGFSVPSGEERGEIKGYHCWLRFYDTRSGWLLVDASEASKDADKRDAYFAKERNDRIQFSTGRDLRLGPNHKGPALNYFIFPYLEKDGAPIKEGVQRKVMFEEVDLPSSYAQGAPQESSK